MTWKCTGSARWYTIAAAMLCGAPPIELTAQHDVANVARGERDTRVVSAVLTRLVTVQVTQVSLKAALDAISRSARVPVQYQVPVVEAYTDPVTVHVVNVPLQVALERALAGTALRVVPDGETHLMIVRGHTSADERQGIITGAVTDAGTKQPLQGATVLLDDAGRGVLTGPDGAFRLVDVSAGTHRVTVRLLGYGRQVITVTVTEGQPTAVNLALSRSANTLDQVVVTGTVIPTELKAVPNAITVITAKQIEERGITKIDQLFRGDVPGLFALNQGTNALLDEVSMFSRGATALSFQSAGVDQTTGFTNPIKTYVDGVELADPKYLSQIDPKSIERIEILTGPQASTIYGSNAINGVMQIFTKRGSTSHPQLTLNLLSGWVENNFSNARTPQHDYSAQLAGIEGRLSYNTGSSWNYMGPWTPAKQLARTDGFGGARLDLPTPAGRVTADMTLRRSITQSRQRGNAGQTLTGYQESGWYNILFSASGVAQPTTRTLTGQTVGLTLSYAPVSWWSHELGLGQDASDVETRTMTRGYIGISDTTLSLQQSHTDRRSINYSTTAHFPVTSIAQLTVTAGTDAWQTLTTSLDVFPQTLTGSLTGTDSPADISRQPDHNTGAFVQSQLGLNDRLFFTYGLRAEWNPNYGAEALPSYAPRYGVAYTQEFGPVTAKLRGAYGRSTRPPQAMLKVAQTWAELDGAYWNSDAPYFLAYYDNFNYRLANPDLAPEHQQGGEGGLELYLGTRGSLVVTRYNQTVDGLIIEPKVDSVRSLVPCPPSSCFFANSRDADGYGYLDQIQYLNIGSIRNQGWEAQGSMLMGPVTTRGTYSWTKSRVIGVNPRYRASFAGIPIYQPGATFEYLPEHTWALGVTYASAVSSIGLNVTGTGRARTQRDDFYLQNLSGIRLTQNRLNVSNISRYINFNAGYAMADLTASHRFASRVEGVLQVQNLTDRYTNDFDALYASLGRQVKMGARIQTH